VANRKRSEKCSYNNNGLFHTAARMMDYTMNCCEKIAYIKISEKSRSLEETTVTAPRYKNAPTPYLY